MRSLVALSLLIALVGCPDPWDDYAVDPPDEATRVLLEDTPFVRAEQVCEGDACAWDYFSGNAPEGTPFTDLTSCDAVWTQGPSWFTPPGRVYESPDSLLEDEAWVAEADWARDQIRSSGCSCCHSSSSGSGFTSGFDVDAPGVWTDSMTNAQLAMSAGMNPMHRLFGAFEAADNHSFSRELTLWASTDPERMQAFFTSEFERRGGDDAALDDAQARFDALFGSVLDPTDACVVEFEGIDADGVVYWNGGPVRQLWIMEEGTASPSFPPNLDRPEGTVWALYVDADGAPVESGAVAVGDVPAGTTQAHPTTGPPELEAGRTYKVFATADVLVGRTINCTVAYAPER